MSTASAASTSTIRQVAFWDIDHELATTRRVLERLPEEHFAWKPHEKSMSLGDLAQHVVNILTWPQITLQAEELDFSKPMPPTPPAADREGLLRNFEGNVETFRTAMEGADDATLSAPWTLRNGDQVFFTQPKAEVLRQWCLSHLIHHRGQLCLYLRLLDVPVPPVYGPTADEPSFG